jgi:protein-disulfide isomerase
MKLVLPAVLVAAIGCTNSPSRLETVTVAAKASDAPAPSSAPGSTPSSIDRDERLARLERRLDKVVAALDQALGPAESDPASMYAVPINEQDPIEGPRDAKVTIVEGYEFLCPYCLMVNPVVEQIRAKYPNDVRVVSKYLVIHGAPAATAGTYACAAAKQGKFAEMKSALWANLWKTDNGRPEARPQEVANLDAVAGTLGLDRQRLAADRDACKQWLQAGQRELAAVGVRGTPAFFVNGRPLRDNSFESFDKLVSEELAKASNSGVAAADYYGRVVIANGLTAVKGRFAD